MSCQLLSLLYDSITLLNVFIVFILTLQDNNCQGLGSNFSYLDPKWNLLGSSLDWRSVSCFIFSFCVCSRKIHHHGYIVFQCCIKFYHNPGNVKSLTAIYCLVVSVVLESGSAYLSFPRECSQGNHWKYLLGKLGWGRIKVTSVLVVVRIHILPRFF